MYKLLFLAAASVWSWAAPAQSVREVADARILSFEESAAPFTASEGSSLSVSGDHYKHGAHALRWQWSRAGARVRIESPVGYLSENPNPRETSVSTFVFWVYAPKALDGKLRFEFRKEGRTCAWFDYGLEFTGWRGAWVAFDRDMQGRPEEGMDELVVTAEGVERGELYFDHLILSSFQDVRHHTADFQAPFINAATTSHWLTLLQSWRNPMPALPAAVGEGERRDMATVERRLRELLLEGRKPMAMKTLRKRFDAYGIAENPDGTLRGKPIWFVRYAETYINLGHPDVGKLFNDNGQTLRKYNDFLFQVAVAHDAAADAAERAELERMYVLLTRHLLDQGFAAGSAQGTLHHLGYSMRNFYTAPVIMRDVLRRAGLEHDVQQAMEWFSGVGEVKLPPAEPGMDIDAFNTSLVGRLASIVMLPDTPVKAAWLEALDVDWTNRNDRKWQAAYDAAARYYQAHGDLNVPSEYIDPDGVLLGKWVSRQRYAWQNPDRSSARLTPERKALLDQLGMVWQKPDSWQHRYELAAAYKAAHGSLELPAQYRTEEGIWLGSWLSRQKQLLQNGDKSLRGERVKALKELFRGEPERRSGAVRTRARCSVRERNWLNNYRHAKAYAKRRGDLLVPASYVDETGFRLGVWISNLRAARKTRPDSFQVTPEHIAMLDEIGMQWDAREAKWQCALRRAGEYRAAHGDLAVPVNYKTEDGFCLGDWIRRMRESYAAHDARLTPERVENLSALGMVWAPAEG